MTLPLFLSKKQGMHGRQKTQTRGNNGPKKKVGSRELTIFSSSFHVTQRQYFGLTVGEERTQTIENRGAFLRFPLLRRRRKQPSCLSCSFRLLLSLSTTACQTKELSFFLSSQFQSRPVLLFSIQIRKIGGQLTGQQQTDSGSGCPVVVVQEIDIFVWHMKRNKQEQGFSILLLFLPAVTRDCCCSD